MPTIVYQVNPKTGVKYAYESISYWDKDKKAPRSRRKYLGRVDPETGEIIKATRSRKQGTPGSQGEDSENQDNLQDELAARDATIVSLREELRAMASRYEEAQKLLAEIHALSRPD